MSSRGSPRTPPTDAWAVGWYCKHKCRRVARRTRPLILHWNGSRWSRVSIDVHASAELAGVTATSRTDAWAVGDLTTRSGTVKTLTLHWNGSKWVRKHSPSPRGSAQLTAVSQPSRAGRLWAAGHYQTPRGTRGLFMYWSVRHFKWVRTGTTPLRDEALLTGIATAAHARPLAVGYSANRATTLAYRWTGSKWERRHTPNPGEGYNDPLAAVAQTSSSDAWAVGTQSTATSSATFILHWNGSKWRKVHSPSPGTTYFPTASLCGVSALSRHDAWAVGDDVPDMAHHREATVALQRAGTKWRVVATPNPSTSNALLAVTATSDKNAWAVGYDRPKGADFRCANPVAPIGPRASILIFH